MSNLSDFLVKPLPGVTKPDSNTVQFSAALPEVRVVATDTTGTGADAGVLRLRNVRQANGAGPNVYLEGTNNASAVKTLVRLQASFVDVTAAAEKTKLAITVLKAGANAAIEVRGDATANVAPTTAGGFALGTQALPWLEAWVGNTGGTRYVKVTSTGPGTDNAIITEGGSIAVYNGAQATLTVAATGLTVGTITVAGASNATGVANTIAASSGHTGTISGFQATLTAQGTSGVVKGYGLTYTGATDYGLYVNCANPGDALEYGVYIDTTVNLNTAAFFQKQRAAAAGSFLVLQNSSGTALFTINASGNIVFGTTGQRLTGDFSNATAANQVMVQSTTTNGATNLGFMPNGSGTSSGVTAYGGSDPANANYLAIAATTSGINVNSGKNGSGTTQQINVQIDGTTSVMVATNGDVVAGKSGLAIGATSGHLFIPSVAGIMTGVPTSRSGFVPLYYDSTNNKLGVYTGGAWKHTAALT